MPKIKIMDSTHKIIGAISQQPGETAAAALKRGG